MGNANFLFLAFAASVVVLFRLHRSEAWRLSVMMAANLVFLASFSTDLKALLPFMIFLAIGYGGMMLIRNYPARAFSICVIGLIALFTWLKRYTFFPSGWLLHYGYITIGISYILFRILHLMVEQRYAEKPEKISPLRYLFYTVNFLTLVSGPIQPYREFAQSQFGEIKDKLTGPTIGEAIERVITGLFKTAVLAPIFLALQNRGQENTFAGGDFRLLWAAVIFAAYPFFLYCNFSGYIDIVIAIGRLLNLKLPENFDRPFSSDSFIGFWNRWHITLSQWLRTYVYTPTVMSLMRRYPAPSLQPLWAVFAFFLTFFLIGVWHGQTSSFLFFGVLQGAGVSVNKLYQILMERWLGRKAYRKLGANPAYVAISRGLTFTWFTFTLIWFWANSRQIESLHAAFEWRFVFEVWLLILIASTVLLQVWEITRQMILSVSWRGTSVLLTRYWRTAWATGMALIWLAVSLLSNQAAPDLVYKAF